MNFASLKHSTGSDLVQSSNSRLNVDVLANWRTGSMASTTDYLSDKLSIEASSSTLSPHSGCATPALNEQIGEIAAKLDRGNGILGQLSSSFSGEFGTACQYPSVDRLEKLDIDLSAYPYDQHYVCKFNSVEVPPPLSPLSAPPSPSNAPLKPLPQTELSMTNRCVRIVRRDLNSEMGCQRRFPIPLHEDVPPGSALSIVNQPNLPFESLRHLLERASDTNVDEKTGYNRNHGMVQDEHDRRLEDLVTELLCEI